jgi:predicted phosphodiesterase
MRYLILSDLHANAEALDAVLARVRNRSYDAVVVLGDFVGYGADPNEIIDRVQRLRRRKLLVRGNHDRVAAGMDLGGSFNPVALSAARWTAQALTAENRKFLADLPVGPIEVDGRFVICHGSPLDEDAYIFSDSDAAWNFRSIGLDLCFFGHSHVPSFSRWSRTGSASTSSAAAVSMEARAGTALPDESGFRRPAARPQRCRGLRVLRLRRREVVFERVPYDVASAREKILKAGLPGALGDRLLVGA